jgi:hypothetical protein
MKTLTESAITKAKALAKSTGKKVKLSDHELFKKTIDIRQAAAR